MNAQDITKLVGLLKYFGYLVDGTIGDLDTEYVNLELYNNY